MSLISIVTVTYNAALTLKTNLKSVKSQTIQVEHIIVDGCSTDSTLDLIKNAYSPLRRFISEPDSGIYDAMNKGISIASSSVIGILNADDFFADSNVLAKVAKVFDNSEVDACYGDLCYVKERQAAWSDVSNSGELFKPFRYWKSGGYHRNKFKWGWMPPHPTFFVRRSIYEKYGLFNLDLGSAADYELMLRFLYKHRIKCAYVPEVLVHMRAGGVSNASLQNRLAANRMDRKAWEVNGLKPYPWTLWMKPLRKIPQYFQRP